MKNYYLALALLLTSSVLFITACDDDEGGNEDNIEVAVNFKANYDGADLAIQSGEFAYPGGSKLKVQLFQYYISDLTLVPADGSAPVILSEIELVRYNSATEDNLVTYNYSIPAGEYTSVQFGLGVKPELNNQPPSNFAADFVLNEAEYWNDNVRYVFAKIEANVDLEDDGTFDTSVSYHMGSNDIFGTLTFNTPITIGTGEDNELTFVADVLAALAASETVFHDFSDPAQRIVHGGNQPIAADIWTRLVDQFVLER